MVELLRTMSASLKSGSTPFLYGDFVVSLFLRLFEIRIWRGKRGKEVAYRFVYIRISRSSFQTRSTTSSIPRSSSQLITIVCGSRASLSRKSMLTLSILLYT